MGKSGVDVVRYRLLRDPMVPAVRPSRLKGSVAGSDRRHGQSLRPLLLFALLLAGYVLLPTPGAEAATCATGNLDGSFASEAFSDSIADDEVDCYTLSSVSVGDQVLIDFEYSSNFGANPYWYLRDGNGNAICEYYRSTFCAIGGAPDWSLEVLSGSGEGTFSYSLVSRRLTSPQGCSSIGDPPSWSFASPRTDGSVDSAFDARCFTFSRTLGEADGSYWFRSVRTGGTVDPRWSVYGPSGARECQGSSGGLESRCQLLAIGQFAFVVTANTATQTGSFLATTRRLNAPSGCGGSPAIAIGAAPTSGSIATAGQTDCYSLSGLSAGDSVSVALSSSTGSNPSPRWSLIDGTGNQICDYYNGSGSFSSCPLTGTPGWTLVVYDAGGAGTFSYSLALRRLTNPQGCSSLGEPGAWSFATPRLNGSIASTLDARCYTFAREPGEEDGAYWFRAARSSGTLGPFWAVYGPTGIKECEGQENSPLNNCRLLASGQYTFLVADNNNGDKTGTFFATAKRLTSPTGCSELSSVAFESAPVSGDLSTGGNIDCHSLPDVASGDTMSIDFFPSGGSNPSPRWTVIDANGNVICDSYSYGYGSICTLSGTAGWSLLVYDVGAGSFSYSWAVWRLPDPEGCTSLGDPAVWSFTASRINGTIDGSLAGHCYTFTRSISDPDGAYWFRTMRSSGTLGPVWSVYGPTGQRECSGSIDGPTNTCRLLAAGQFAFVISDGSGNQTGTYFATPKRLTSPEGCSSLSSIAFGIAPVSGKLSSGGEIDCYRLKASAQDTLQFTGTGSADVFALVDDDGFVRCNSFSYPCTITEDGEMTLLIYSANGTTTGNYRFEAECLNVPCGQSNTAVNDVTPNRIGPSEFTSVLIRGRDLELLESAKLVRGGASVVGDLQDAAPDGRAVEARFDLAKAAQGDWDLEASFIDGSTRVLPGAVAVEPLRSPRVSVELIGREALRANRPSVVTLSVHNSGNVDAMIVPVALSGIPAGSTIEPLFEMRRPVGSTAATSFEPAPFNQASDAVSFPEGITVPLFLPRVPAGRTMALEFSITAPQVGAPYTLRAVAGQCLGASATERAAARTAAFTDDIELTPPCIEDLGQTIIGFVPFGDCFNAGYEVGQALGKAIFGPMFNVPDDDPVGVIDGASFGLNALGCGLDATGVGGVAKRSVEVLSFATGAAQLADDCYLPQSESELPQRQVAAIDPNEIIGPVGVGPERYLAAEGPLGYRVLFENLPAASAPAQRVEVDNQLDAAKFDPETVLFEEVHFGSTSYSLPYPSHELETTIDLRPARNLLVEVDAGVSPTGLVKVTLQAIDPDTLEPPDDPLEGFLPPNTSPPQGEGYFSYTVSPQPLPSGTVLTNRASIRFDDNDPIETPTWSNVIDRQAPSATVGAEGTADPASAEVSWSGTDDAAGISLYEVRVSRDGGPYTLWTTADEPGSETFTAPAPGTYSFRVLARDGADNVGQSSLAGVTLQMANQLTLSRTGTGSGTVTSNPAGLQCGSTCSNAFPTGSKVTLTATPDAGSVFAGWSGGGCSGIGACIVSLDTDASVTAKFDPAPAEEQPKAKPTPTTPIETPLPATPQVNGYEECVSAAVKSFKKTSRVAKKKHGKARSKALKAAQKRKGKALAGCRSRFQHN